MDWESLYQAYRRARKGKRYNADAMRFQNRLEENITTIQNHLIWGTWRPGRWKEFMVYDPKRRLIHAPPFQDRVVHHSLVDAINPFFEKKFIKDSYACRVGMGFHSAAGQVQSFLRCPGKKYVLKADIAKYFQSICHLELKRIIRRTLRDKRVLGLCDIIITDTGFQKVGIPVGALTSQLFANVYLDQLDHYIKDHLAVEKYCRYMDDFVIVSRSKKQLWELLADIEGYLNSVLKLSLNPKTDIFPPSKGVDFCGYRVWDTHILPRRRIVHRARRDITSLAGMCSDGHVPIESVRERVMSFLGYMRHCSGHYTTQMILQQATIKRRKK